MSAVQSYIEDLLAAPDTTPATGDHGPDRAELDGAGPRVWEAPAADLVVIRVAAGRIAVRADAIGAPARVTPTGRDVQGVTLAMGGTTLELMPSPSAADSDAVALRLPGTPWWLLAKAVAPLGRIERGGVRWRGRREMDPAVVGLVGPDRLPLVDVAVLAAMLPDG